MNKLLKFLNQKIRLYRAGVEYWVDLDDIIVPNNFKKSKVGKAKWKHKLDYWKKNGKFESKIMLNRDFVLVDGFSSVKIAYLHDVDKVPVYFVN